MGRLSAFFIGEDGSSILVFVIEEGKSFFFLRWDGREKRIL